MLYRVKADSLVCQSRNWSIDSMRACRLWSNGPSTIITCRLPTIEPNKHSLPWESSFKSCTRNQQRKIHLEVLEKNGNDFETFDRSSKIDPISSFVEQTNAKSSTSVEGQIFSEKQRNTCRKPKHMKKFTRIIVLYLILCNVCKRYWIIYSRRTRWLRNNVSIYFPRWMNSNWHIITAYRSHTK